MTRRKPATRFEANRQPAPALPAHKPKSNRGWTLGVCPVCRYPKANVDPDGVLWCPACGYSKKGCYT
ncbi:MAG: hypothetical protein D6768_05590 [Chloroflexi bacterium]|nr:MAG: hypothetical protein D6768_05590 [Chloroflexota bacterium]